MKAIFIFLFPFVLVGQKITVSKFDDKAYHYYLTGFISSSNAYGMYQLNDRVALCGGFGFGVGMLAGISKEIYDQYKQHPTGFNYMDLGTDFLGSGGGWFGFAIGVDQVYRNKEERRYYKSVKKIN